jgi:hypothetical protein
MKVDCFRLLYGPIVLGRPSGAEKIQAAADAADRGIAFPDIIRQHFGICSRSVRSRNIASLLVSSRHASATSSRPARSTTSSA